MMPRRAIASLAIALVLSGCVGPATTTAAYRGKVVHATDAALSEVRTVALAGRALLHGRMFQPYAEVMISGAEDALSSVQSQFDSIQPPDDKISDKLRSALDTLLTSGLGEVSDIRIAVRRDHPSQLPTLVTALDRVADKLQAFSAEHGG